MDSPWIIVLAEVEKVLITGSGLLTGGVVGLVEPPPPPPQAEIIIRETKNIEYFFNIWILKLLQKS